MSDYKRTREEILADWDAKDLKQRQMCAHWMRKLSRTQCELINEASLEGWHDHAADMAAGFRAALLAVELLAHDPRGVSDDAA